MVDYLHAVRGNPFAQFGSGIHIRQSPSCRAPAAVSCTIIYRDGRLSRASGLKMHLLPTLLHRLALLSQTSKDVTLGALALLIILL